MLLQPLSFIVCAAARARPAAGFLSPQAPPPPYVHAGQTRAHHSARRHVLVSLVTHHASMMAATASRTVSKLRRSTLYSLPWRTRTSVPRRSMEMNAASSAASWGRDSLLRSASENLSFRTCGQALLSERLMVMCNSGWAGVWGEARLERVVWLYHGDLVRLHRSIL